MPAVRIEQKFVNAVNELDEFLKTNDTRYVKIPLSKLKLYRQLLARFGPMDINIQKVRKSRETKKHALVIKHLDVLKKHLKVVHSPKTIKEVPELQLVIDDFRTSLKYREKTSDLELLLLMKNLIKRKKCA